MAKRIKHSITVFDQGEGWRIERQVIGAATYWNIYQLDWRGYVVPGTGKENLGTKAKAAAAIDAARRAALPTWADCDHVASEGRP